MNLAAASRAILPPLVALCARNRLKVLLIALLVAAASVYASATRLGVTTDTGRMFSDSLPWKQRSRMFADLFPQNDALIVAVVDARIPEEAEATAAALSDALQADHTHFTSVRRPDMVHQPGKPPYLQSNAFLLVDMKDLQDVLDRTTDAQPFLGELVADPSMRGLFSALGLLAQGVARGATIPDIGAALGKFHDSLSASLAGHAAPLSW